MSESRRDLFKLSVLGAVGLSSCTGFPREPDTGTPSLTPKRDTVVNQGDIFAFGKLDDSAPKYWFLLQRLSGDNAFAAYYVEGAYDVKPEVITATCISSTWKWALVPAGKTITITGSSGAGDGASTISVGANSIISRDLLTTFLSGSTECAMSQRSWSEINRV